MLSVPRTQVPDPVNLLTGVLFQLDSALEDCSGHASSKIADSFFNNRL